MDRKIHVHIVTYRGAPYLSRCLEVLAQSEGVELLIEVTHNGEEGLDEVKGSSGQHSFFHNQRNLGFCGAYNQAIKRFLDSDCDTFLCLNPDLALERDALRKLQEVLFSRKEIGMVCPLLLRSDEELNPLVPEVIDSSGMVFTNSLRHFDRHAEKLVSETPLYQEEIAGASGACILMKREFVEDMLLVGEKHESDLFQVFPQLQDGYNERAPFFDEAFFAYREDAELSLRAVTKGWSTVFVPDACGYHVRRVTPERRSELSEEINRHGVRNRFLLQLLHWDPFREWQSILPGFIMRNILVIGAVLFMERSSFRALIEVALLSKRARERRKILRN